jgi:hypothetical protein
MACKHPPLPEKPGSRDNWVEQHGGLPEMIDCVARALYHEGKSRGSVSRAVQMAVGIVQDWAAGRRNATPKTRARAAAAVARWNAMRAAAKAD